MSYTNAVQQDPSHPAPEAVVNRYEHSGVEVIDVAIERYGAARPQSKWLSVLLIGFVLLAVGSVYLTSQFFAPSCCLLLIIAVAIPVMMVVMLEKRITNRQNAVKEISQSHVDDLPDVLVRRLPEQAIMDLPHVLRRMADEYEKVNSFGRVLRIGPNREIERLTPFEYPFEPRKVQDVENDSAETHETDDADECVRPDKQFFKWLRRNRSWLTSIPMYIFILVYFIRSGGVDDIFIILTIGLAGPLIMLLYRKGYRECQLVAVPGGLVVRASNWRSREWRLDIIEPRKTVFVAFKTKQPQWQLILRGQSQKYEFTVTRPQLTFILHAWLSPLSPPTLEQLSDLK